MVSVLFWNIRRLNPKGMEDPNRYLSIMGVISQYSVVFIIENMVGTEKVLELIGKKLTKYGAYKADFGQMGGYKGTDEKLIVITKTDEAELTGLYALDRDGKVVTGTDASFNRLLMVAELGDGVRIGCVHFPGPGSGADHAAELTRVKQIAEKFNVLMIGGDFNTTPPLPGDKVWEHKGPTDKGANWPTTIDNVGGFVSAYDWVLVNRGLANTFTGRATGVTEAGVVAGYAKASDAHHVSDHVPVSISYTLPPRYKK